ncbi:hypothetical protein FGG08_004965 [Glutinoglossum americanum]|uniref:Osmotin, thaumatin-like protein n=1 Tax=Glutinoglossum americanum TaxID=1670608 RepID=A0A9P8I3X9_9PEZI|nr:hypothetical protein FGG08_004965 [Glutinoglossum americanum]
MCAETIYPAISTQAGIGPGTGGFLLSSGDSRSLTGETPVTLAEFTLDSPTYQTYYDISLVDGYNLDVAIILLAGESGNSTIETIPPNLTNPACIASTNSLASPPYDPYAGNTSTEVLGTNSSFPLPFENTVSTNDVSRWCPWDLQLLPPTKPGDGVYPYPDDNIPRPVFDPCYSACAKFNKATDCCTGEWDSPNKCKPGLYSQNVKKVCPDAYSYAFDDQTSTFIIPSGGGFEVAFCPKGRSTNILAAASAALHQLAQGNVNASLAMGSNLDPMLTKGDGSSIRERRSWLGLATAVLTTLVLKVVWS